MYLAQSTNRGTLSRSNWNLEVLVFEEMGKPEYPEKTSRSKDENQQQTQPTYDAESGNRTRATLVGGLCHPCSPFLKSIPYFRPERLKTHIKSISGFNRN